MAEMEHTHQKEQNSTQVDDLVTKTIFGDRKNSDTFFGNR